MSFPIEGEHYVVVTERDLPKEAGGKSVPIAWETPLDGKASTREAAEQRAGDVGRRYGRTRIARLVFVD